MMKIVQKNYTRVLYILIIVGSLFLLGCEKEPPTDIAFYYMEVCPGCDSYLKADSLTGSVFALAQTKFFTGRGWNLGHGDEGGYSSLKEYLEKYDIPDISYSLPLLFVAGDYYVGYEEIEKKIRELQKEFGSK